MLADCLPLPPPLFLLLSDLLMPRKEPALAMGFVGYAIAVIGGVSWKVLPSLEVPAYGSTSCT